MLNVLLDETIYSNQIVDYIKSLKTNPDVRLSRNTGVSQFVSIILNPNLSLKGDQFKNAKIVKRGIGYNELLEKTLNPVKALFDHQSYMTMVFNQMIKRDFLFKDKAQNSMIDSVINAPTIEAFLTYPGVFEANSLYAQLGIEQFLKTKDLFYLDLSLDVGRSSLDNLIKRAEFSEYHTHMKKLRGSK